MEVIYLRRNSKPCLQICPPPIVSGSENSNTHHSLSKYWLRLSRANSGRPLVSISARGNAEGGRKRKRSDRERDTEGCRWWAGKGLFPSVAMVTHQQRPCDEATVVAAGGPLGDSCQSITQSEGTDRPTAITLD